MRIAFVVPSLGLAEGQGSADLELLRRVARAGHTIDVFAANAPPLVRSLAGVTLHRTPRLPAWQLGNQLLSLGATSARMRRARYDLVHADAGVTLRRADVLVVHTVTDRWLRLPDDVWREPGVRGAHEAAATRFKARLEIAQARAARAVVANSAMTARDLAERGVDPARISVVPFGVDSERWRPPGSQERADARARFGLDPGAFVTLFVGAHGPRKGFPEALAALERAAPGETMLVMGEHRGGRWAAEARAKRLPVIMPGKTPEMLPAYWAADVLVYPSRYDAFGMAVLEAMACGLPVIVSPDAGSHELVADAGIVLDDLEPGSIRDAIDRLRVDPDGRARMAARARRIARSRTWDESGATLLNLYARI